MIIIVIKPAKIWFEGGGQMAERVQYPTGPEQNIWTWSPIDTELGDLGSGQNITAAAQLNGWTYAYQTYVEQHM